MCREQLVLLFTAIVVTIVCTTNHLYRYKQNVQVLLNERTFLVDRLAALSIVKKIHHTDANFILFVVPKAQDIYKTMADSGLVCRYRGSETHCADCLRLTVGTRQENEQFLKLFVEVASKLGVQ